MAPLEIAEHERPEAVRIAHGDERILGEKNERVGALLQFLVNRYRLVVLFHIKIELCQLVLELGR